MRGLEGFDTQRADNSGERPWFLLVGFSVPEKGRNHQGRKDIGLARYRREGREPGDTEPLNFLRKLRSDLTGSLGPQG